MRYSLLSQFEKLFHRTAFKAVEDMISMTADEQRWFIWCYRVKTDPSLLLPTAVEEWTSKEMGEAVGDFFGVATPSTPS